MSSVKSAHTPLTFSFRLQRGGKGYNQIQFFRSVTECFLHVNSREKLERALFTAHEPKVKTCCSQVELMVWL